MRRLTRFVFALDAALARRLVSRRDRAALCVMMAGLFLCVAAARLYPFVDDVTLATAADDDWLYYKQRALSILRDGVTMPAVTGNYATPGGFLYNYFVAGVFALFGVNAVHVYLVQAALLGVAIAAMFLVLRSRLPAGARLVYLGALTAFLAVDVFLKYTVRLLSENLLLFLLPLLFWCALRAIDGGRARDALAAGAVLGVGALTRPNVILLAPGVALLLAVSARRGGRSWLPGVALFACALGTVFSLMALRNYAVTGELSVASFTNSRTWNVPPAVERIVSPSADGVVAAGGRIVQHYLRRLLYCAGFLFVEGAKYPLMPHWVLMWIGVAVFSVDRVRRRRIESWEALMVVFLVLYLGPLVAVSHVSNYGIRMIFPVIPAALALAVRGPVDRWSRTPVAPPSR